MENVFKSVLTVELTLIKATDKTATDTEQETECQQTDSQSS